MCNALIFCVAAVNSANLHHIYAYYIELVGFPHYNVMSAAGALLDVGFPGGIAASLPELLNEAIIRTTWVFRVSSTLYVVKSVEYICYHTQAVVRVLKHRF